MCHSCKCDNSHLCSIVGYVNSPGFCCVKCELYTEDLSCLKSKFNFEKITPKVVFKESEKTLIIPNE
ncbi:MAG: hypothetical protein ACFFBH_14680 [Promethearchaeota archaeon]